MGRERRCSECVLNSINSFGVNLIDDLVFAAGKGSYSQLDPLEQRYIQFLIRKKANGSLEVKDLDPLVNNTLTVTDIRLLMKSSNFTPNVAETVLLLDLNRNNRNRFAKNNKKHKKKKPKHA